MEGQPRRQWGLTASISEAMPTKADLEVHAKLIDELKHQNNFESPEATERRFEVLNRFQKATEEFVRTVGKAKGLSQSLIENAGGKIFTFGSYRLGVYGPGSDIDTLVVAPKHVDMHDFFKYFPPILERMSSPGDIEELTPVPDAHVPILKIEYAGISIDLIFVSLALSAIPLDLTLKDKGLLRGLDDTGMRSVNGTRVTDEVLDEVPQPKTFRIATRAIKLWAQRRGIYGNVFGFPGGIAWALLVARVCQLYPMACGGTVALKFFNIIAEWPWPRPIMLKAIEEGPFGLKVWNPQVYRGDNLHLMPIITPAFPSMCATHNITHSTKNVIVRELQRGKTLANEILAGKKSWKDLFDRHTFFTSDYKYYLSVVSASRTREAQNIWSGYVQSRIRLLIKGIDESDAGVECAHPFNKGIDRVHRCTTEEEHERVLSGSLEFKVADDYSEVNGEESDDKPAADKENKADKAVTKGEESNGHGAHTIYTTTHYIGIKLAEGRPPIWAKTLDISFPVQEFRRVVTSWTSYDADLNSMRVVHTRNYDLPADLFEPGETRPARTKKSKTHRSVKRSFAESGLDVRESQIYST
ncbi:poly(A) polymerase Pap [Lepidopterella palustris CBS 459.81]|uniref:Poly(A) polymerase n=1 Tax=Lepidopterella palustris CBS 459.81 TaxID=1314670 RepID=A0A8E2ECT6_9PEZI|nr:poly(A) polymerase Pap [Lepidopterella palustris CBS 459.81]